MFRRSLSFFHGIANVAALKRMAGLAGIFALCFQPFTARAANDRVIPLSVNDAVSLKRFNFSGNAGIFSPSGNEIAYVMCDPALGSWSASAYRKLGKGIEGFTNGCRLYLIPAQGGTARRIGRADANVWRPQWSPDGKQIAYMSDRGGAAHLWVWNRETNVARQVSSAIIDGSVEQDPVWLHDSRTVILPVFSAAGLRASASAKASASAAGAASKTTLVLLHSGSSAARASTADTLVPTPGPAPDDIAAFDTVTGNMRKLVTGVRPSSLKLSPDGLHLAFENDKGGMRLAYMTHVWSLEVYDIATHHRRTLVNAMKQGITGSFSWSPDGSALAYIEESGKAGFVSASIAQPRGAGTLFVISANGGTPHGFSGDRHIFFSSENSSRLCLPLWSADGKTLFLVTDHSVWKASLGTWQVLPIPSSLDGSIDSLLNTGDDRAWSSGSDAVYVFTHDPKTRYEGFARIDLRTGTAKELWDGKYTLNDHYHVPVASPDGSHVAFDLEDPTHSKDLWIADKNFQSVHQLTTLNPQLGKYTFGKTKFFEFTAKDGERLPASILLPADYHPGQRYPTLVWVYASDDESSYLYHFGFWLGDPYNFQLLSTRGYAVLAPDIPVKVGQPIKSMMNAVMPAIDRAVQLGIVDPNRLALSGQSNGGYTTLSILTQTHRFKAAIMNAGFGDLTGFFGCMTQNYGPIWINWLETGGGAMGVPPWKAPAQYVQNSPVYFLNRITTPLLIQDGGDDKCIVEFSDQVFIDLQSMNKDVTYLRYGGEGHVLEQVPNIIDYWTRVLAFLHEHIGGLP